MKFCTIYHKPHYTRICCRFTVDLLADRLYSKSPAILQQIRCVASKSAASRQQIHVMYSLNLTGLSNVQRAKNGLNRLARGFICSLRVNYTFMSILLIYRP
jgi:hypothetical protein